MNFVKGRGNKSLKRELQWENKLMSYEKAFKMLENDRYIARICQAVLELLKGKSGQKISYAQMKEREKCKTTSHH